jgi:hypothetical protein
MAASSRKKPKKKKLGRWKIKRVGDNQLSLTLPDGMSLKGNDPLTIEDLLTGIANYMAAKKGPVPECCTTNLMVA